MRSFSLKQQVWFFGLYFAQKELLPVKNRKRVHHHWILYNLISLGTKFQLKLTILNFWTKFIQKLCFQSGGKKEASLNSAYSNWFTVIHKKFVTNAFLSCSATLRISQDPKSWVIRQLVRGDPVYTMLIKSRVVRFTRTWSSLDILNFWVFEQD